MKKLILLFLTLISINSAFALNYDFEVNGLYYKINPDGNTVSVVNPDRVYIGDVQYAKSPYKGDIVIPETVVNFKVTEIGPQAFYRADISSIVIPDSVTTIGGYAFSRCQGLTTIKIPDSVTTIGGYAFSRCQGLTTIKIPDSVIQIGDYAFDDCDGLTTIKIPDSVTSIGKNTFSDCDGLTTIKIPDSVTSIGGYAFASCDRLESVTLPKSLKVINPCTFWDCTNLSTVTIPSSLKSITRDAFSDCSKLKSIFIPRSVTEISWAAFLDCSQLKSVIVEYSSTGITKLSVSDYADPDDYPGIFYGAAVEYLYMGREFELGCGESLKTIEFGDGIFTIKSKRNFSGCTNLETIIIPKTTISIHDEVFQNCRNIYTIYVRKPEPPILGKNTFSYDTYSKAELHVPKGTKEKYSNATYWSSFANIIDDAEMCGIEDVTSEDTGQEVTVYNLQGQFVLHATDADQLQTLSPGIYIKVAGNKAEKIVVR